MLFRLNRVAGRYLAAIALMSCSTVLYAQRAFRVHGRVSDSTGLSLPGAHIRLFIKEDTLNTVAADDGRFTFNDIKSATIVLQVNSIGYVPFRGAFEIKDSLTVNIVLQTASGQLSEVVIKSATLPVKIKKDTIEYNAGALKVHQNDRVEDLLRQLPGIAIDADGNVTANGKPLTKIRVNGKDFFTGNVQEFIRQIPAETIAKLQVIDDYGDAANFSGDRTRPSQKLLNLITKPKKNYGYFGDGNVASGSQGHYSGQLEDNFWQEKQHIGVNAGAGNTNTGAGLNKDEIAGMNYRNIFGKGWSFAGDYFYHANQNQVSQQSAVTTVNDPGNLYSANNTKTDNSNSNNQMRLDLKDENDKDFFNLSFNGQLDRALSLNNISSVQTGIIRQDLATLEGNRQQTPLYEATATWIRKLNRPDRMLSIDMGFSRQAPKGLDTIRNKITFFDQSSGQPLKDSIQNRLLETEKTNRNFRAGISYTEPLNKRADTVKNSIAISYNYSVNNISNNLNTLVGSDQSYDQLSAQLSNNYSSTFAQQSVGIAYKHDGGKLNYQVQLSGQPNILTGQNEQDGAQISRTDFNFGGAGMLSYRPDIHQQLQVFYFGGNNPPAIEQLQPVPDTRNLQNIVIGNPELKPEFNNSLNIEYRYVWPGSGASLQVAIDGALVEHKVVSNVKVIPDTLGSLKQETLFLNANGNYKAGAVVNFSLPFAANRYALEFRGSLHQTRDVVYINDMQQANEGLTGSAAMDFKVNEKKVNFNLGVSYNASSNAYSVSPGPVNDVSAWQFYSYSRVFFSEKCSAGVEATKSLNQGYGAGSTDPFILSASIEQNFLKKKNATLKFRANDIFAEGNYLNRQVSANSITDSKSNVLTRYFLISFIFRLEKFGA